VAGRVEKTGWVGEVGGEDPRGLRFPCRAQSTKGSGLAMGPSTIVDGLGFAFFLFSVPIRHLAIAHTCGFNGRVESSGVTCNAWILSVLWLRLTCGLGHTSTIVNGHGFLPVCGTYPVSLPALGSARPLVAVTHQQLFMMIVFPAVWYPAR
jgi:hypothetical protein